jgi:uncharacterized protein (UPF0332 family)
VHDDLFAQALMLARADAKKPKQANLRRAVSSAYYAMFHFLIDASSSLIFGTQHAQAPYRQVLGRAFAHGVMKAACVGFAGGTLKDAAIKGLPRDAAGAYPIHPDMRGVARAFADLQEKRHLADYDRTERFRRSEVLFFIEQAQARIAKFAQLPMSDDKRFFLACLWAWKELSNR